MKEIASICCVTKNHPKDCMNEWIDYHLSIGFDNIYIYDNSSETGNYLKDSRVKVVRWEMKRKPQLPAYRDYLSKYKNDVGWTAFLDDDEYIVLKKHSTISDLLEEYKSSAGLVLNWKMFGSSGLTKRSVPGMINNFTRCEANGKTGSNRLVKTIARNNCIRTIDNPHALKFKDGKQCRNLRREICKCEYNNPSDDDIAWINHYFTGSLEDWNRRRSNPSGDGTTRDIREFNQVNDNCTAEDTTLIKNWNRILCDIEDRVEEFLYLSNV